MSEGTVLDKATRLGQRLDRIAEDKNRANQISWLPQQITKLREALNALRTHLALARTVNDAVGSAQIDLTKIDAGFDSFKKRADDDASFPSRDSWRNAIKHVISTTSNIADRTSSTWQTWSDARLAELPTDRIKLIDSNAREQADRHLGEMRRIATARPIEPGYVARFQQLLSTLRALLDSTPTMPSKVAPVLKLFELLDTVTLHDLTSEHIDVLRQSGLDKRIVLHWEDA